MKLTVKLLVNFIFLATVGILLLIFSKVVVPNKVGFFCSDVSSISYPYKSSTIPSWLLCKASKLSRGL